MYKDLLMDRKGEYLGAGGNPMSTTLERVYTKFVFPCINIPQCRHFVAFAASV